MLTMCFHTRDAIRRDDSSFTFRLPSNRIRNDSVKVALASCEFPMVQWTIEKEWNRFYFNEGIYLTAEDNYLDFVMDDSEPVRIQLPPRINRIKHVAWSGKHLHVECDTLARISNEFPQHVSKRRTTGRRRGHFAFAAFQGDLESTSPTSFRIKSGAVVKNPMGEGSPWY